MYWGPLEFLPQINVNSSSSSCGPATVRSPILFSITVIKSAGELLTSRTLFSLRLKRDASADHCHPSILCGKQEDGIEEATIPCIALASQRHKATRSDDGPWKFGYKPRREKDFLLFFLHSAHTDTEVKENDWNLSIKQFFTIKSTILYIFLTHMSVKNHQLLWNRTNYTKKNQKCRKKIYPRIEKYCTLGVFTSFSSVCLCTKHYSRG